MRPTDPIRRGDDDPAPLTRRLRLLLSWWAADVCVRAEWVYVAVTYRDGGPETVFGSKVHHAWRVWPGRMRPHKMEEEIRSILVRLFGDIEAADAVMKDKDDKQCGTIALLRKAAG